MTVPKRKLSEFGSYCPRYPTEGRLDTRRIDLRKQARKRNRTGRTRAINTNAPLTKVAWIRGNNGCNRKYRVRPLGATRPRPFRFHRTLHPSARRASPTVVLSTESGCPSWSALDSSGDVCPDRLTNRRTCGHAAERIFRHAESTSDRSVVLG